jgi:hypothetical protein
MPPGRLKIDLFFRRFDLLSKSKARGSPLVLATSGGVTMYSGSGLALAIRL